MVQEEVNSSGLAPLLFYWIINGLLFAFYTFLSPHRVVAHRRKMMAKAECQTIGQVLKYAREHNLI